MESSIGLARFFLVSINEKRFGYVDVGFSGFCSLICQFELASAQVRVLL
jgi:hypothetical protein